MKTITAEYLKSEIAHLLDAVKRGEAFAVTDGPNGEIVAYLVGKPNHAARRLRPFGFLGKTGSFRFVGDFKISEEEFL